MWEGTYLVGAWHLVKCVAAAGRGKDRLMVCVVGGEV